MQRSLAARQPPSGLHGQRRSVCVKASQASPSQYTRVRLKTRSDCELGISIYPNFRYNAVGGGGWGSVTDLGNGLLGLKFDASVLVIPDMSFRTTSLLGLPIPPPLNIAIRPLRLEGTLDQSSGQVELDFDAEFVFSAGPIYRAPAMQVRTRLTTEEAVGERRRGQGSRLAGGAGRLAGVACVEKVGDVFLDNFLLLPNDALAVMSAEIELQ